MSYIRCSLVAKKLYSFMAEDALLDGLKILKKRTGLTESEQIRRGIAMWLEENGIESESRREMNVSFYMPKDPSAREALLVVDVDASEWFDADDLEVLINMARGRLEQLVKHGDYSWTISRAVAGGFTITLKRGPWQFLIGPLTSDVFLVRKAKEQMGAADEPIEVDGRIRGFGKKRL